MIALVGATASADDRPNILWLVQEDALPWIGCYGYETNVGQTLVIGRMARDGVLFGRAYVPAPVCSSCRSAFIVGSYQFRFGAHEHRSRRGKAVVDRGTRSPSKFANDDVLLFLGDRTHFATCSSCVRSHPPVRDAPTALHPRDRPSGSRSRSLPTTGQNVLSR